MFPMPGQKPGASANSATPGTGAGKGRGWGLGAASKADAKDAKMREQLAIAAPNSRAKGKRAPGGAITLNEYRGDPEAGVRSGTPFYQAPAYQGKAGESAVDRENIPAAYRKQVKEYFESLRK